MARPLRSCRHAWGGCNTAWCAGAQRHAHAGMVCTAARSGCSDWCVSHSTLPQGVGSIFGELAGLCGTRLPGSERVVACGNSFGRGPLVYHFPDAAVAALRKR